MNNFLTRILLTLAVPLIIGMFTFYFMNSYFGKPLNPKKTQLVRIEVPRNSNFRSLCKTLQKKKIIRHWRVLDLHARFGGDDTKIKAGEYELSASMTPKEILTKLSSGEVYKRSITVKEGANIWEIAVAIQASEIATSKDFLKAVQDKTLLSKAGIKSESFEGYLYPETYNFSKGETVERIIWTMLEQGEKKWLPEFSTRSDELNLTRHEVLTLASIIEKESGNFDEQGIIGSVFHNRMETLVKLQADPTVIYGLRKFGRALTKKDLETPNPYNTYVNYGLPPGPIGNPGESAIKAALYPEDTSFLYFVADGKGRHVFSKTLAEHNEAVHNYRSYLKSQTEQTANAQ